MHPILLEISLDSVESAIIAEKAGADRIELCTNLSEGGTTPSLGMIQQVRKHLHIPIYIIIRPRAGDFCYSEEEFEIMKTDIRLTREAGADGVVFGILKPDGGVDTERTTELVELSRPMSVTFHRAFDMTSNPTVALEAIISSGANRILTSGQKPSAWEGMQLIAQLVQQAGDRIIIMPGAGINETNILDILKITQATEFHMSAVKSINGRMLFRPQHLHMGHSNNSEYELLRTDTDKIRKIKEQIRL
ncbi:MAG TPA: copper homeostasis protein CutC [Candidatus Cloacimonadota bacterium]|nr:copper homeostasis protein CutC [Candidatus Cloacimonadota bacterium]HPT70752.1 copper homeostasis protein CutC [Candidatus Cloacimonadota bacterium]